MNLRKLASAVGALALTVAGVLAFTGPAHAEPVHTSKATIKNSPDDGCPKPWARDTFTRTTTITPDGEGKFKVVIRDEGTFTTTKGAPSPGAAGTPIEARVTGSLSGSGEYTVTGTLRGADGLANLDGRIYNNGGFACKADVPVNRSAGRWPLLFFQDGATTTGIDPWTWTYATPCEKRTESSAKPAEGNIVGLTCPAQVESIKATCKDKTAKVRVTNPNSHARLRVSFNGGDVVRVEPGKSTTFEFTSGEVNVLVDGKPFGEPYAYVVPEGCEKPGPGVPPADDDDQGTGGGGGDLPVTGAPGPVLVAIAGVLLVAGVGGVVLARRRRTRFVA